MASLLLVTEDPGFATAAEALSTSELTVTHAHAEEAIAIARRGLPDVFAVDTDSVVEAGPLITALSLVTRSIVVAVAQQAWPGSEAADAWRRAGADAVLPKPSGSASPSLAGADREAYAQWVLDLVRSLQDDAP
jgi:hypothetical protein